MKQTFKKYEANSRVAYLGPLGQVDLVTEDGEVLFTHFAQGRVPLVSFAEAAADSDFIQVTDLVRVEGGQRLLPYAHPRMFETGAAQVFRRSDMERDQLRMRRTLQEIQHQAKTVEDRISALVVVQQRLQEPVVGGDGDDTKPFTVAKTTEGENDNE